MNMNMNDNNTHYQSTATNKLKTIKKLNQELASTLLFWTGKSGGYPVDMSELTIERLINIYESVDDIKNNIMFLEWHFRNELEISE